MSDVCNCGNASQDAGSLGDVVVRMPEDGRWLIERKVVVVDGMEEGGWLQGVVDTGFEAQK